MQLNIVANFIGRFWGALMAWAFVPIYIRFMGIESYGLVGFFATLQTIFMLINLGLGRSFEIEVARLSAGQEDQQTTHNLLRTLEILYWTAAILIVILLIFLAPSISNYWLIAPGFSPNALQLIIVMIGILIGLNLIQGLYGIGLLALQKQVRFNVINSTFGTLQAVGAILALSFIAPTIQVFFEWQIIINIIWTVAVLFALRRAMGPVSSAPRFDKKLLLDIRHLTAGITGIAVLTTIFSSADKVILSKMLTLEYFGYYTLAWGAASLLALVTSPIATAVFPRMVQIVERRDEGALTKIYHQSCQLQTMTVFPIALVLVFFSSEFLFLWTGSPAIVANAHIILSVLVLGAAIASLSVVPQNLQLAYKWTKLAVILQLVSVIALIPLIIWLTINYGIVGAPVALLAVNIFYVAVFVVLTHQRYLKHEYSRWLLRDTVIPAVGTATVVVIARLIAPASLSRLNILFELAMIFALAITVAASLSPEVRPIIKGNYQLLRESLPFFSSK
ncbi:MAG: oligosaccharide flippase family protein [Halobacteriota archaeon]|jgi:O-antigen/teichoic acid export membrane protein